MRNAHAQIFLVLVAGVSFTQEILAQTITQPSLPDHGFTFVYGVTNTQLEGFDWSMALQNVNFEFVPADSTDFSEVFPNADFAQQVPAQTGGVNSSFYE